jgi:hypothetical protein
MSEILEAARLHAANVAADLANCRNRIEQIRITRLAVEAAALVEMIEREHDSLIVGPIPDVSGDLVYTENP